MYTRPDGLSDADVASAVRSWWAVDVSDIEYAPVGFGSHHWRIAGSDGRWFVTVDDLTTKRHTKTERLEEPWRRLRAALATARTLADQGLDFVVAPTRSSEGDVLRRLGDRFALAVYPHVDGEHHEFGDGFSPEGRLAVVDVLAELHRSSLEGGAMALSEQFAIPWRHDLEAALGDLEVGWSTGPFADATRRLLVDHRSAVVELMERYDRLGREVSERPDRMVLTHGEPHAGNTITTSRGVVLIDWDTAMLAPPERDLWSLIDLDEAVGVAYSESTDQPIDRDAVELYRLAWDLSEVAIYVNEFRRPHRETDDTRTAWAGLAETLDAERWRRP